VILEKTPGKPYATLLWHLVREKVGVRDTLFLTYYPADFAIADGYDESLLPLGRKNLTGFRSSLVTGAFSAGGPYPIPRMSPSSRARCSPDGSSPSNEEKDYSIVVLSNLSVVEQTRLFAEIQNVVLRNEAP
jgi:hypothetical protein